MKTTITFLLLIISSSLSSQEYNVEDGYIANGYDVVEYFNNQAKPGNKAFTTTYDLVKFKFINAKNLATFKKNPLKYIPQFGGFCAYAMGKKAERVNINPETYEIRDKKLYLFYDSWFNNTAKKWTKENTKKLQKQADINWEKINKK